MFFRRNPPENDESTRADELRTQAERQIRDSSAVSTPTSNAARLELDYQAQQHELQVHQIEFSLQMDELQRNNAELQRMRDTYRDLYDLTPVGYFTLSEDGRILEVNRAGCQLLGAERGKLIRQRFSAYLNEDSGVPFALLLRRAFANGQLADQSSGQTARAELTLALPGGGETHIQLDARAEAGSHPPYLRAAVTDISALKRAQQDVITLNADLEQRVQDRTARIRELSDELETFVQAVTHNLQTPLRQFTALAELLRRRLPDGENLPQQGQDLQGHDSQGDGPQTRHYVQQMLGSVDRLNTLVTALADYFRTGQQSSRSMSVSLERVLEDVERDLQPQLQGREVVWHKDPLPTVTGDPQNLKDIFTALLDNALKFSAGQERSEISILARETGSEYLIGVRDNGVGFNATQQGRLFGVFQRLHSERDFSGLGIGLARVRRAALRQGGRVWAEGKEGRGSCFWVALPRDGPPAP
ncbi:ATP-binding protein [Deinococcus saxicola]|uniref:sensor histidine kinase n=1 Tax=Deinococcus saxicola TaxID=249406 RepID=UPI0039EEF507